MLRRISTARRAIPCPMLARLCEVLAPCERSRGARWRWASPHPWSGTGCGSGPRWCRRCHGPPPPRSRSPPPARPSATRASTPSRCGRTSRITTCRMTTLTALLQRLKVDYPIRCDRAIGLGTAPDPPAPARARPRGPGRRRSSTGCRSVHWSWFLVPHGTLLYMLRPPPRAVPALGGDDGGLLRPRLRRLLGASRPRRRGTRERTGDAAGAADHGGGRASASGDASGTRFTIRCKAIRSQQCPHSISARQ